MFGGCSDRQAMNDTWIFDPDLEKWVDISKTVNAEVIVYSFVHHCEPESEPLLGLK